MIISRYFILVFLICLSAAAIAQTIQGQVVAAEGGNGLGFVNIGVLNNTRGTVSDEQGHFSLDLSGMAPGDTLRFSLIGYEIQDRRVGDLQEQKESLLLKLRTQAYDLVEVVVVPVDYREKVLGNRVKGKFAQGGFSNNELGHEIGVKMKVKKRPTWLEEVYLNISRCDYDSIFYRLNIYQMDGKRPGPSLLKAPIYLEYSQAEALAGELTIDLRPYHLYTEKDFVVSLEIVKDLGPLGLYMPITVAGNKSLYRYTSQSPWAKLPVGFSISTKVKQER